MAGGGSPDFSAIILLCDSVACPEGKLYIQGGGWRTLQEDLPDAPGPARGCSPGHPGESAGRGQRQEVRSGYAIVSALEARSIWMSRSSSAAVWGCGGWLAAG